jgi:hypothetical protein
VVRIDATGLFAHSFWLYAGIAAIILTVAQKRERNPVALFFMLLFLMPPSGAEIPGFGVVNYFFVLNHVRLLAFFVLPAFLALRRRPHNPFGRTWPDKLLAANIVLTSLLYLRETTATDALRQTLYLFIECFCPTTPAGR